MKRSTLSLSFLVLIVALFLPASGAFAQSKGEVRHSSQHVAQVHSHMYITNNIQQFFQQHIPLSGNCAFDGCDNFFALNIGGECISGHTELDSKPVQLGSDHYGTLSIWAGGSTCGAAYWTAFQNITGSNKYVWTEWQRETGSDAESAPGPYGGCATLAAHQYAITEMLGASAQGQGFYGNSQTSDQSSCNTLGTTNTNTEYFE